MGLRVRRALFKAAALPLAFGLGLGLAPGAAPEAAAHVPNIATFELVQGAENSRLDVHMSTDGLHHVIAKLHPDESFATMTPEAYEDHVVAALRAGIDLRYDDQQVALGAAEVTLAAHQSDVSFAIPTPPASATAVHAHIDVMRQQHNQNNVFRLTSQTSQHHVVLSSDNGFRGSLSLPTAPALRPPQGMRLVAPILSLLMLLDLAI